MNNYIEKVIKNALTMDELEQMKRSLEGESGEQEKEALMYVESQIRAKEYFARMSEVI